jgi:hypothetical protein
LVYELRRGGRPQTPGDVDAQLINFRLLPSLAFVGADLDFRNAVVDAPSIELAQTCAHVSAKRGSGSSL